jgi:hypothetical protein
MAIRGVETRKREVQPEKPDSRVEGESKSAWRRVMDWSRRYLSLSALGSEDVCECVLALCVGWVFIGSYADDEVFGVDEVVVEYGIEDGRAELACGAGEGELSHVCCIIVCVVSLRLLVVLLLYC